MDICGLPDYLRGDPVAVVRKVSCMVCISIQLDIVSIKSEHEFETIYNNLGNIHDILRNIHDNFGNIHNNCGNIDTYISVNQLKNASIKGDQF